MLFGQPAQHCRDLCFGDGVLLAAIGMGQQGDGRTSFNECSARLGQDGRKCALVF